MSRDGRPGFRRLAVALQDSDESRQALLTACSLAGRHSRLLLLAVVEVPTLLPLDAHMEDEDAQARALLAQAEQLAEERGLKVTSRLLRAREASEALLEEVERHDVELLALGVRPRLKRRPIVYGTTVERLLQHAPCRVLLVSCPQEGARTGR